MKTRNPAYHWLLDFDIIILGPVDNDRFNMNSINIERQGMSFPLWFFSVICILINKMRSEYFYSNIEQETIS